MDWKGSRTRWSCPKLKNYPVIRLVGLGKTTKNFSQDSHCPGQESQLSVTWRIQVKNFTAGEEFLGIHVTTTCRSETRQIWGTHGYIYSNWFQWRFFCLYYFIIDGKVVPSRHEDVRGSGSTVLPYLTSALDGGEWSAFVRKDRLTVWCLRFCNHHINF
jgi:hypothetical protein